VARGGGARNFPDAWAQYQKVHPDAGLYEMGLLGQAYGKPLLPTSQAQQRMNDLLERQQTLEMNDALTHPLPDVDAQAQRIFEMTKKHREEINPQSGPGAMDRALSELYMSGRQ
jgi:hypothetical protein